MDTHELFLSGRRSELRRTLRSAVADPEKCRDVVSGIARYHRSVSSRCTEHPGHPILHTALCLSFECLVNDTEVVSALLTEVYRCERTFERVFAGAIFGIGAGYLITGWKSEFHSKTDNTAAVEYFLTHATKSRLTFDGVRFGEVRLKNAGLPPLEASLQVGNLEMACLLIKFGVGVGSYRWVSPLRLLLLCKLRIRCLLHSNWGLPFGLGTLPLPRALITYMETVDLELVPPRKLK